MASSVENINSKIKNKNKHSRLDSRIFHEKPSVYSSGSVASQRIGDITNRSNAVVTIVTTDNTILGKKEGPVTILGDDITNNIDFFRYGKDVKSIKSLLNDRITPNITLGKENDITSDDHIDSSLEICFYGQNSFFKTYDHKNKRFIPFEDFEGKPLFKNFIGLKDEDKKGYPHVYNEKRNYDKFRDPDPASLDGAIEVFHVRNSPANTGFLDLQIKGARGLFGVGNWELTQHTTYGKKGSPSIKETHEISQLTHDFFEDASESILGTPVEGYISEGLNKGAPFVDKENYLNNQYEHLNQAQKNALIVSSSRDESEIGTRFKSRSNGRIITPFYKLVEQRSFGTDSISFSDLLKG